MRFDWTINIGTILTIATLIGTSYSVIVAVKNRLHMLENVLQTHADALKQHDSMLGKYETRIFELVGGLQRLIGRFETLERMENHNHKD